MADAAVVKAPLPRERVGKSRVTGAVADWKGKFGWIKPNNVVDHPDAGKHKGKIYFAQADVEAEIEGVGAAVDFLLYKDATGLGACHVRPVPTSNSKPIAKSGKAGKPEKKKKKRAPREPREQPPPDKTAREAVKTPVSQGKVRRVLGKVAFIKPDSPVEHALATKHRRELYLHFSDMEGEATPLPGATVTFSVYSDPQGLGAERCKIIEQGAPRRRDGRAVKDEEGGDSGGKAKTQKAKDKAEKRGTDEPKGPSGPDLPRQRISAKPIVGEVLEWKNKHGWIKPQGAVDHPMAEKHNGRIYVNLKDVKEGTALEKGMSVQFYCYADASGLGAEDCLSLVL